MVTPMKRVNSLIRMRRDQLSESVPIKGLGSGSRFDAKLGKPGTNIEVLEIRSLGVDCVIHVALYYNHPMMLVLRPPRDVPVTQSNGIGV